MDARNRSEHDSCESREMGDQVQVDADKAKAGAAKSGNETL